MKKNIINSLLVAILLMLTGCGSNSKKDPAKVTTGTPNLSAGQYFLVNETRVLEVNANNQEKVIRVDVVNKDGIGVSGKKVSISAVAGLEYGEITGASTVDTDQGGHAIFTYTSPDDISSVNGKSTTVTLSLDNNGTIVSKNVEITFNLLSGDASDRFLVNESKIIEVNFDNEQKSIRVDVVNGLGIGVEGQEVYITAVPGAKYGSIQASSATSDAGGHVNFVYTAPTDVAAVNGDSINVTITSTNNGETLSKVIQISFNKQGTIAGNKLPIVTTTQQSVVLTTNSQNIVLEISVFDEVTKNPYTEGNVRVTLPDESINGVDVGTFESYLVPVENGKANFNYTGPRDLKNLIDNQHASSIFKFSHEDNPASVATIEVKYQLEDGYVPSNYSLTTTSPDGEQTMGLDLLKTFTLYLKDDQGTVVADSAISKITITSKNTTIGKLKVGGTETDTVVYSGEDATNNKSFPIQTYQRSGLLPIEIIVNFQDANGVAQSRSIVMNIVVFSGPPTAINISYAGVALDSTRASYIEKFVITVTDTYNNPVNTKPYVAVGAMVEYAVDGSSPSNVRTTSSPRLWHGLNDSTGNLVSIGGGKAQFEVASDVFKYIDFANDRMVIFGQGYAYEALGKWDISGNTNSVLSLVDSYGGSTRNNLFYAVGHNHRQDLCKSDGTKYIGTMRANSYQLDEQGHALIEFQYNYHLTGKDIMVWANLTGLQADNGNIGRLGEAKKHTLRGNGFVPEPTNGYTVPKFTPATNYIFNIHHATAPEYYRNGHFGYALVGNCIVESVVDSSNYHDARDCANPTAYVILRVSNPSDKDCTVGIENITVAEEFTGTTGY